MAIFRAGKRVGPFDIRVGFPRDRSYDRIDYPANYTKPNPERDQEAHAVASASSPH